MAVLWHKQSATVGEVAEALKKPHGVSYSTVQTILRILENKHYVKHAKVARAFQMLPSGTGGVIHPADHGEPPPSRVSSHVLACGGSNVTDRPGPR